MEKNDAENILWVFSCIHEGWLTKLYVLDRDSLGDQKEKLIMVRYRTFILQIDPFLLFKCDDNSCKVISHLHIHTFTIKILKRFMAL